MALQSAPCSHSNIIGHMEKLTSLSPKIDHLQVTVQDLNRAENFYDMLMPLLGFNLDKKSRGRVDAHEFDVIEYFHENLIIGFNSPRSQFKNEDVHRRKPGSIHHIAFRANSESDVDTFYEDIKKTVAKIIEPPRLYPQHGAHYYAVFFKDTEGIKWELVYEKRD